MTPGLLARKRCRVTRSWYRTRTTRRVEGTFYVAHNRLTQVTTLVIEDADGRKMQVDFEPDALNWFVKLCMQFFGRGVQP